MNIRQLVDDLKRKNEELIVIALSSNPEKHGTLENVMGLHVIQIQENYVLNKIQYIAQKNNAIHLAWLQTSIHQKMTVKMLIAELLKVDQEIPIVYHAMGYTMKKQFFEIDTVKEVQCERISHAFRDIMDSTDYVEDVYEIRKNGIKVVLLYNKKEYLLKN
jgi:hypothetical protein